MGKQKSKPPEYQPYGLTPEDYERIRKEESQAPSPKQGGGAPSQTMLPQEQSRKYEYGKAITMQELQEGLQRGELVRDSDNRVFRTRPSKSDPSKREKELEAVYNIRQREDGSEIVSPRVYGNIQKQEEFDKSSGEHGEDGFIAGLSSKFRELLGMLPSQIPMGATTAPAPNPVAIGKDLAKSQGKTYVSSTTPRGIAATAGEITGDLGIAIAASALFPNPVGGAALFAGGAATQIANQAGRVERGEANIAEAAGRTAIGGLENMLQAKIAGNIAKNAMQKASPHLAKTIEKLAQSRAGSIKTMEAIAQDMGKAKFAGKVIGQNAAVASGGALSEAALETVVDDTPEDAVREALQGNPLHLAKEVGIRTAFGTALGAVLSPFDINAKALAESMPSTAALLSETPEGIVAPLVKQQEDAARIAAQDAERQASLQAAQEAKLYDKNNLMRELLKSTQSSKLQKQAGIDEQIRSGQEIVRKSFFGKTDGTTEVAAIDISNTDKAIALAKDTGANVEEMSMPEIAQHLVEVSGGKKPLKYVQETGVTPLLDYVLRNEDGKGVLTIEKAIAEKELATFIQERLPTREEKQAALYVLSPPENKKANIDYLNKLDDTQLEKEVEKAIKGAKGTQSIQDLPEVLARRVDDDEYAQALRRLEERGASERKASELSQIESKNRTRLFMREQVKKLRTEKAEAKKQPAAAKEEVRLESQKASNVSLDTIVDLPNLPEYPSRVNFFSELHKPVIATPQETKQLLKDFNKRNPFRQELKATVEQKPVSKRLLNQPPISTPQELNEAIRFIAEKRVREERSKRIPVSLSPKDNPKPDIASPLPDNNVAVKHRYVPEDFTPKDAAQLLGNHDFDKEMNARGVARGTKEYAEAKKKYDLLDKRSTINLGWKGAGTYLQLQNIQTEFSERIASAGRQAQRVAGRLMVSAERKLKSLESKASEKVKNAAAEINIRAHREYMKILNDQKLKPVEIEEALEKVASIRNIQNIQRDVAKDMNLSRKEFDEAFKLFYELRSMSDEASRLEYRGMAQYATNMDWRELASRAKKAKERIEEIKTVLDESRYSKEISIDKDKLKEEMRNELNIVSWLEGENDWVKESSRRMYMDVWSQQRTGYRVRINIPERIVNGVQRERVDMNVFIKSDFLRDREVNKVLTKLVQDEKILAEDIANPNYIVREEVYSTRLGENLTAGADAVLKKAMRLFAPENAMRQDASAAAKQVLADTQEFSAQERNDLLQEIDAFLDRKDIRSFSESSLYDEADEQVEKVNAVKKIRELLESADINREALSEFMARSAVRPRPKRHSKGVTGWEPENGGQWEFWRKSYQSQISKGRSAMTKGAMLSEIARQQKMFDEVALRNHWTDFLERKTTQLRGSSSEYIGTGNAPKRLYSKAARIFSKTAGASSVSLLTFNPKSPFRTLLETIPATTVAFLKEGQDLSPKGILKAVKGENRRMITEVWKRLEDSGVIENVSMEFLQGGTVTGKRWEEKMRQNALVLSRYAEMYINRLVPALLYTAGRIEKIRQSGKIDINNPEQFEKIIESLTDNAQRVIQEIAGDYSQEFKAAILNKNASKEVRDLSMMFFALKRPVWHSAAMYAKAVQRGVAGVKRMDAEGNIEAKRDLSAALGLFVLGGALMGYKYYPGMKDIVTLLETAEEYFNKNDERSRLASLGFKEQVGLQAEKLKNYFVSQGAKPETFDKVMEVITEGAASAATGYDFSNEIAFTDLMLEFPLTSQASRIFKTGKNLSSEQSAENISAFIGAFLPVAGRGLTQAVNEVKGRQADPSGAVQGESEGVGRAMANAALGQRIEDKKANEAARFDRIPLETSLQRRDFAQSLFRTEGIAVGNDDTGTDTQDGIKADVISATEKDAKKLRLQIYEKYNSPDVKTLTKESLEKLESFFNSEEGEKVLQDMAGYTQLGGKRRAGTDTKFEKIKTMAKQAVRDYYLSYIIANKLQQYDDRIHVKHGDGIYRGVSDNDPDFGLEIESFPPKEQGFRYALTKIGGRIEANENRRLTKYLPLAD